MALRLPALLVIPLLAVLAACGGTIATTAPQVITTATSVAAVRPASPAPASTRATAAVPPPALSSAPTSVPQRATASAITSASPRATTTVATSAASTVPTSVPSRTTTAAPLPASPTTAASLPPAPTRPPAATPSGPTPVPQPNGAIPAGWKIYRGPPALPFVVAYPPDWTADDSLLPEQTIVFFYGPGEREDSERIDIEISQTGDGANIDVQRDDFFNRESAFCDAKGIEFTARRQISGVPFAILGATCDASNTLSFMQVASGLVGGDEWNVLMRTPYDRKEARLRQVFDPMLASLNIYAKVP